MNPKNKSTGAKIFNESINLQASSFVCVCVCVFFVCVCVCVCVLIVFFLFVCLFFVFFLFLLRFGLAWFAKIIIVASNDINEDTLFSLNQQVHCAPCVVLCKLVMFIISY